MARVPGISRIMRQHPVLAILGAATASLALHQSVASPCSSSIEEPLAIQLHNGETVSYALPEASMERRDFTVRVVIQDIGDDPAATISPVGVIDLTVTRDGGLPLAYESILALGDCRLSPSDILEDATWLSLRRDRDVDFVHTCDVTLSVSIPAGVDAGINASWSSPATHASPPVLLLVPR